MLIDASSSSFHKKVTVALSFERIRTHLAEVESKTQPLRSRTQKKSKARTDFLKTDPLRAKDRNGRGQGHKFSKLCRQISHYF